MDVEKPSRGPDSDAEIGNSRNLGGLEEQWEEMKLPTPEVAS